MNITRELKKISKNNLKLPYAKYLLSKKIIKDYYIDNKERLLKNEKSLISRYKKIYILSNRNPVGLNIIIISIACSLLASLVFMFFTGSNETPGIAYSIAETLSNLLKDENFFALDLSQQAIVTLSIAVFILLVLLLVFIFISLSIIALSIVNNSVLQTELIDFELAEIEKILNEKYCKENWKENSMSNNQTEKGTTDGVDLIIENKNLQLNHNKKLFFFSLFDVEIFKLLFFSGLALFMISNLSNNPDFFKNGIQIIILIICIVYIIFKLKLFENEKTLYILIKKYTTNCFRFYLEKTRKIDKIEKDDKKIEKHNV